MYRGWGLVGGVGRHLQHHPGISIKHQNQAAITSQCCAFCYPSPPLGGKSGFSEWGWRLI